MPPVPVDLPNGNTLLYRVDQLEHDIEILVKKLDRLTWALVSLSVALMSAAISLAIAVMVTNGGRG